MDDASSDSATEGFHAAASSPKMSTSTAVVQVEASNDTSSYTKDDAHDVSMESYQAPPTQEDDRPFNSSIDLSVAVSQDQDDESDDAIAVTQEDAPSSLMYSPTFGAETTSTTVAVAEDTQRRRPNSEKNKSANRRRRSLRLQEKDVLAPLTPEKMSTDDGDGAVCGSNAAEGVEESTASKKSSVTMSISKLSSRRRSHRIQGLPSPAVDTVKRSTTKRNYSRGLKGTMDGDTLPSPKKLCLGEKDAQVGATDKKDVNDLHIGEKEVVMEVPTKLSPIFEIGISENGHVKLTHAFQKIAFNVVISPSNFGNVSKRKSLGRKKKRARRATGVIPMLEPLDESNTTCVLNSSIKRTKPKNRRDTFDLSKKRGLTSAAKRIDLNILIDESLEGVVNPDYVTPKASSTEMHIDGIVNKKSKTLDDEPKNAGRNHHENDGVAEEKEHTEEDSAVMMNLLELTSTAIEVRMKHLFPDKISQMHNYPCVSTRLFASMSIVYADQADFTPLLPFLLSLVNAEFMSLKDNEENEVYFISKKVCFSGFDYSSTTTAVGEVVGQGELAKESIEALERVLQQANKLARPIHYLDAAIRCLQCMASSGKTSDACATTMSGYFPSARYTKAIKHYVSELKDVKLFVLSQNNPQSGNNHIGVRYRLNDFIGRSVRYDLRELLNTIPENVIDFDVGECEERWGRAVDDRSISSILNFSLEKIHELMNNKPKLFEYGVQDMPDFFTRAASTSILSLPRDILKKMDNSTYESLVMDITEARAFLFGARACKFVLDLLKCPGVEEHIDSAGGWASVETIASTFYNLDLHEGSENQHFVHLRQVRDLIFMLEDVDARFERTVDNCEYCIRRMRRKFNFKTNKSFAHNIKVHLAGEKGEYFPSVVVQSISEEE